MNLTEKKDKLQQAVATYTAFVAKYFEKFPIDQQSRIGVSLGLGSVDLSISLTYAEDSERLEILGIVGEAFGRQGWTADPDYLKEWFTWVKKFDGVTCTITGAEKIEEPVKGIPVPSGKFPLLLTEAA